MQYVYVAYVGITALTWSVSPIIGRGSGVNGLPMALLVAFGTLLAALPILFLRGTFVGVTSKGAMLATGAGVVNGIGLITLYLLIAGAADGRWEVSKSIALVYGVVPVLVAVLAYHLYGEAMTTEKWIGLGLLAIAFWFLK